MLKAKNLNKYYSRFPKKPLHVIDNTTVEIPETGIIAVVGPSGAGKTTLINTISGLDSFKDGSISFEDVVMTHYSNHIADKLRMKNYGFIFQNYYLLEKETVYQNVRIALDAFDISEAEKKKRINYVLNQLGIAKYTNKLVTSLSGGEQQRVSIARALVKSPRIIFADEPTGSLDEKTTFTVFNILKKISKNCAVFIVTHEKDVISYYADYILELDNGVVIKEFKPTKPEKKSLAVDQNIYLSELDEVKKETIEDLSVNIYSDHSNNPGDIKIAIKEGKIYLEASSNIVVLNEQSENHILEGKKRELEDYVDEDFNYELEPLEYSDNHIRFSNIFKKGYQNYRRKSHIKNILKGVCLIFSAVLMVLMQSVNSIQAADLSSDLSSSKGNLYVEIEPNDPHVDSYRIAIGYRVLTELLLESDLPVELYYESKDRLSFEYPSFYQIQNGKYELPGHDFIDIDYLDSNSLVFGHMPTNPHEVVIDEYVLKKMIGDTLLKTAITDYGYFIDKTLSSNRFDYKLTICGVCRTKSPTIYGYEGLTMLRSYYMTHMDVIDIDYARELYPDLEILKTDLKPGCCYRRTDYINLYLSDYMHTDETFLYDELPYDLVINRSDFDLIKKNTTDSNDIYLYVANHDYRTVQLFADDVKFYLKNIGIDVNINLVHRYQNQYDKAVSDLNDILRITLLIALIVGAIAIVLIIISTYFSMLNQIADIAVYRSLGYSRFYLGLIYFVELLILSLIYCFAGGILSYFVMFVLDVIPLVPFALATPIIQMVLISLGLVALITIIGIVPVMLVFGLTPAKIYSKYNKRINNA